MLWTEDYRPKSVKEVLGNPKAIKEVEEWIGSWKKGKYKALLLYGPPGTGKTSLARAIANDLGYDFIELNASDQRSYKIIKEIVGPASQTSTLNRGEKRLILLDEIDGITGREDRGGVKGIIEIIKDTRNPIILIANDPYATQLRTLKSYCKSVEFKKIHSSTIVKILEKICKDQGIEFEKKILEIIAKMNEGDLRSAINDLQSISQGRKKITQEDLETLSSRDREESVFNTLSKIFKSRRIDTARKAILDSSEDPKLLIEWIASNIPEEYENSEEIRDAYEYISRGDVFMGRIIRRQYWGFLGYVSDLISCGVSSAKNSPYKKFTRYKRPSIFYSLSRTKKEREMTKRIATKIGAKTHKSSKLASMEIPFLKTILKNNKNPEDLIRFFEFDEEEVNFLIGDYQTDGTKGKKRKSRKKQSSLSEF